MFARGVLAALLIVAAAAPALAQDKQPPYWASIAQRPGDDAHRPGPNYPGVWLYQRRDLPVRVVKKYRDLAADPGPGRRAGLDAGDVAQRPAHGDRQARRSAPGPRRARTTAPRSATMPSTASSAASTNARRRLVPDRDRQARRLYPHVRPVGRRARTRWWTDIQRKGAAMKADCSQSQPELLIA